MNPPKSNRRPVAAPIFRSAPWLVLVVGLLISFAVYHGAKESGEERQAAQFSARAQRVIDAMDESLRAYERVLRGTAGFFAAHQDVSREGFRTYVESLSLDSNYPGFLAIGYAPVIPSAELGRHVDAVRAEEGLDEYAVHPPGDGAAMAPVLYLEPWSGSSRRALGFDLHSEPVREAALARARDVGGLAVSERLQQRADIEVRTGPTFHLFAPVYRGSASLPTEAARRAALRGWVFAPLRMQDFLDDLLARDPRERIQGLRLEVFDGDTAEPGSLIYDKALGGPDAARSATAQDEAGSAIRHAFSAGGHQWTIRIAPLAGFTDPAGASSHRLLAAAGIALSVLLALIVHLFESAHRRARRIAQQMTRELAESEARFRLMAESAPVMIWMSDAEHRCTWMNQRWRDFAGPSLSTDQHEIWREVIHPDDFHHAADAYFAVVERREPFRTEVRVRRSDGVYRWIINTGVPRFDAQGEFAGYIGSCLDITERKQAEKRLHGMARRLEQYAAEVDDLYQHAPCGYHSLDIHGNIVAINDTELRWLGYTRDELAGKPFTLLLTAEGRTLFLETFPPGPERTEYRHLLLELVRKDGTLLPASISATLVRDKDGGFLRTRSVVHDMTEHQRAERERAEHVRHIEALSRRLVAVQEEERRRLAANLHDWTSPNLATLKLLLATVASASDAGDNARVHGALEDAQALLVDTTAGLREICSELRPTVLDFSGLCPALDSYAHQFRQRTGIDVRIRASAVEPLSAEAQTVLFRIAQEAFANALKHAGASAIELVLERDDHCVRMRISDDGMGFDVAAQTGLTPSVAAQHSGGLGLITMRERAQFVGGRLHIDSAPGSGATISVEIPVSPASPAPAELALDLQPS